MPVQASALFYDPSSENFLDLYPIKFLAVSQCSMIPS
jgi:hypothetical protein